MYRCNIFPNTKFHTVFGRSIAFYLHYTLLPADFFSLSGWCHCCNIAVTCLSTKLYCTLKNMHAVL